MANMIQFLVAVFHSILFFGHASCGALQATDLEYRPEMEGHMAMIIRRYIELERLKLAELTK